jgi:hydroxymethylglutaryl-CoA synthase
VAEYERLMALPAHAPEPVAPPPGGFRLAEVREHRRHYAAG